MHATIRRGANVDRSIKLKLERMRLSQGLPSPDSSGLTAFDAAMVDPDETRSPHDRASTKTPYHNVCGEPLYECEAVDITPPFSYIPPPNGYEGVAEAIRHKPWLPRSEFDKDLKPRPMQLGLGNDAERPLDESFKRQPYV